jgi:hypothetical protein
VNGVRGTRTGRSLYVARPIQIKNPACLACHSEPKAAPASMLKTYGEQAGFGWQLNEIVGAQVVSVPMAVPMQRARTTFYTSIVALVVIFLAMFVILNIMLDRLVIKPIVRMSAPRTRSAAATSNCRDRLVRTDEVAKLAQSFNHDDEPREAGRCCAPGSERASADRQSGEAGMAAASTGNCSTLATHAAASLQTHATLIVEQAAGAALRRHSGRPQMVPAAKAFVTTMNRSRKAGPAARAPGPLVRRPLPLRGRPRRSIGATRDSSTRSASS